MTIYSGVLLVSYSLLLHHPHYDLISDKTSALELASCSNTPRTAEVIVIAPGFLMPRMVIPRALLPLLPLPRAALMFLQ